MKRLMPTTIAVAVFVLASLAMPLPGRFPAARPTSERAPLEMTEFAPTAIPEMLPTPVVDRWR